MPSLVKIGPVVLEFFVKSCEFIFIISQLSLLWEGRGPSFVQTWIPITLEIGPVVLEKKMKIWKVYRQTDGQTDRRLTTDDQESSRALSSGFQKQKNDNNNIKCCSIFQLTKNILKWIEQAVTNILVFSWRGYLICDNQTPLS